MLQYFSGVASGSTFNRTMLELKFYFLAGLSFVANPFNRTMLELKFGCPVNICYCRTAFNRTMLELK